MSLYACAECNKHITRGVFVSSMDHYRTPLCRECQEKIQRYIDVRCGGLNIECEKILKCARCGGTKFPRSYAKSSYCASCWREISRQNKECPFSRSHRTGKVRFSGAVDADRS